MDQGESVYRYDPQDETLLNASNKKKESDHENSTRPQPRPYTPHVPTPIVISGNSSNKKGKKYVIIIAAGVIICILSLALVAVVVYGPLANNISEESSTLNTDFQQLKLTVNRSQAEWQAKVNKSQRDWQASMVGMLSALESRVNQSQGDWQAVMLGKLSALEANLVRNATSIDSSISQLTNLLHSAQLTVNTLNTVQHQNTAQLNSLQSIVNSLAVSRNVSVGQLSSLQASVSTLNAAKDTTMTQLDSLQNVVNGLNSAQHTTTTQLHSLTTRLNTPVNIYENCTEEMTSCSMSNSHSTYYRLSCTTSSLAINITSYYTVDMRCEFQYNYNHMETAILRKSGSNVQCDCSVTNPRTTSNYHSALSSYTSDTCYLKVMRCPTSLQH